MSYLWLGKKYNDLLRKNANIRGKRSKSGCKEDILTVLGEKISFMKKWGGGAKKSYFGKYTPLVVFEL